MNTRPQGLMELKRIIDGFVEEEVRLDEIVEIAKCADPNGLPVLKFKGFVHRDNPEGEVTMKQVQIEIIVREGCAYEIE